VALIRVLRNSVGARPVKRAVLESVRCVHAHSSDRGGPNLGGAVSDFNRVNSKLFL
jgi:hypothetical protein